MQPRLSAIAAVAGAALLAGCSSFGARQVPNDHFDYNRAIGRSMQEQMLLNVVRLRYLEAPVFLTVSSVLTQYVWLGTIAVSAQEGFSVGNGVRSPSFLGAAAGAQYAERPTITYLPIEGDDFAKRMLKPLPLDFVLALTEAGYPTDLLLRAGISRINEVSNLGFAGVPGAGPERAAQLRAGAANLQRYQQLISDFLRLYTYGVIEVQQQTGDDGRERVMVITPSTEPEVAAAIASWKQTLRLDPTRNVFRITERRTDRAPDEITVQTRSLLQIMAFLAQGVDVPPEQRDETRNLSDEGNGGAAEAIPLRVRASRDRPDNAFAAVDYNGYWFSVANTDITSKRSFNLLIYAFRLLAPERAAAAPALALPTGP